MHQGEEHLYRQKGEKEGRNKEQRAGCGNNCPPAGYLGLQSLEEGSIVLLGNDG